MSLNSEAVERFRQRRRALVYEVLGYVCARCGVGGVLEADHIDPATKAFTIADRLQVREDVFLAELAKCQHLCKPCHIEKTRQEQSVTECAYGHSLEGDNLVARSGTNRVRCRTCKNRTSRESKERIRLDKERAR